MSLFGRREKNRIADLEARDLVRRKRISDLEELVAAVRRNPDVAKRREGEMAARIVRLERESRAKDEAITRLGRQLDDAIGVHNPGYEGDLDDAGRREAERRAKAGTR
jgi:hypothetical protein